jgi:hypothetical protein
MKPASLKELFAGNNRAFAIDHVLGRAMTAIADFINSPQSTLVVFNAPNWQRDGLVEVDIDKGMAPVDLPTRQAVPYELVSSGKTYRRVRFMAHEVPAVGYKNFGLQAEASVPPAPLAGAETILENTFYRVALDSSTGSVAGILDKEINRELVDRSSPYRFNQDLYVTGADELPNRLVQYSTVSPAPDLKIHPSTQGRVISVKETPLGVVARLASSSSNLNTPLIETEIFLPSNEKRIEFVNRVRKDKVFTKEGAYFAFPFGVDNARFRYSTQNEFVDPEKDLLPGAGREWFSAQQWVAVDQGGVTAALVPVDAPLLTLGARGSWPREFERRKGVVFSYVMNNYTPEGYLAGPRWRTYISIRVEQWNRSRSRPIEQVGMGSDVSSRSK